MKKEKFAYQDTKKDQNHAEPKRNTCQDADDPMDLHWGCGPSKPEQASWQRHAPYASRDQPLFWGCRAAILVQEPGVPGILDKDGEEKGEKESHHESEEGKTGEAS